MCVDLQVIWEITVESPRFQTISAYAHLEEFRMRSVYRWDISK